MTHELRYEGPPDLAVQATRLLADSPGIELTSAGPPQLADGAGATVVMVVTVEGTPEAVSAALATVQAELSGEVSFVVDDQGT